MLSLFFLQLEVARMFIVLLHTHTLLYHNIGVLKERCLVLVVFEFYYKMELMFHAQHHITRIHPHC